MSGKIRIAPSNLDKLAHMLNVVNDTVAVIKVHESIGRVNVHSHGEVIDDVVELTRRAHEMAKAFQLEIQGR